MPIHNRTMNSTAMIDKDIAAVINPHFIPRRGWAVSLLTPKSVSSTAMIFLNIRPTPVS